MKKIGMLPLIVLWSIAAVAQISVIPKSYVDSLIKSAKSSDLYYFEQLKIAEQALEAANAIAYSQGAFHANMVVGISHLNMSKYDQTLQHFQDANRIATELDSIRYKAYSAYYLGNVYNHLNNKDQALTNFKASYNIYKSLNNVLWQGIVLNSIGVVYAKHGDKVKALSHFQESLKLFEAKEMIAETNIPINNIGDLYSEQGKIKLAKRYHEQSLAIAQQFDDHKGIVYGYANVALDYQKLKQYEQAKSYFLKGLAIAKEHQFKKITYEIQKDLADLYEETGDTKQSLSYLKKYVTLKDSIFNEKVNSEISRLQVSYKVEHKNRILAEKEYEINELKVGQQLRNISTAVAITGIIGLLFLIWLVLSRSKAKQLLIEKQLENEALKSKQLEQDLKHKQQDLTNFALDISRKNAFSAKIHTSLKSIVQSNDPALAKKKARALLMLTSNHLKINDDIKSFQENVEKVNQEFFNNLNNKHPDLTASERQLSGLIRLNLNTKDIAAIRNISPKSVEMGRYRLRKKLALGQGEDITAYLQQL